MRELLETFTSSMVAFAEMEGVRLSLKPNSSEGSVVVMLPFQAGTLLLSNSISSPAASRTSAYLAPTLRPLLTPSIVKMPPFRRME